MIEHVNQTIMAFFYDGTKIQKRNLIRNYCTHINMESIARYTC